ncbi:MAG TPA: fibronectin type III domain-containing protein, partial [bacterium]|nr:fibronectin type III domain-containing protein [bacterium]
TDEEGVDLSINLKGLTPAARYYFKVVSLNASGNIIGTTPEKSAVSSNGIVSWFNITGINSNENGDVEISWTQDFTSNEETQIAGYRIIYDTASLTSNSQKINVGNVRTYALTGFYPGTTYYFGVESYGSDNKTIHKTMQMEHTIQQQTPPPQFEITEYYADYQGVVFLRWSNYIEPSISEYRIEFSKYPDFSGAMYNDITTDTFGTVTGIAKSDTYYFRVQGMRSGVPSGDPTAPVYLYVSVQTLPVQENIALNAYPSSMNFGAIQLYWAHSIPSVYYYELSYETGAASSFSSEKMMIHGIYTVDNKFEIMNLTPNQNYRVQIEAYDEIGQLIGKSNIIESVNASDSSATVPFEILDLYQTANQREVYLNWNHSTMFGINQYQIEYSTNIDFSPYQTIKNLTNNEAVVSDLTEDTTYYFRVQGTISGTPYGDPTPIRYIYIPSSTQQPYITLYLSDGSVGGSINAEWSTMLSGVEYFKVWFEPGEENIFSGGEYSSDNISANNLLLAALTPDTFYRVQVRAYDIDGFEIGASDILIKKSSPSNTSGFAFDITSYSRGPNSGEISLSWSSDNTAGITGYEITYDTSSQIGQHSPKKYVNRTYLQTVLTGLQPNIGYYIAVSSVNELNESVNYSRGIYEYPAGSDNIFEITSITNPDPGYVNFQWTSFNGAVDEYEIKAKKNNESANSELLAKYITSTNHSLSNIQYSDTYFVVVLAYNQGQLVGHTPTFMQYIAGLDATPTNNFSINYLNQQYDKSVFIGWNSPTDFYFDAYQVEYRKKGESPWTAYSSFITGNNATLYGITGGDTYQFRVQGQTLDGDVYYPFGDPTPVWELYVSASGTSGEIFEITEYSNYNQGEISLKWNSYNLSACQYRIISANNMDFMNFTSLGTTSDTSFIRTGLSSGDYYIKIEAIDGSLNVLSQTPSVYLYVNGIAETTTIQINMIQAGSNTGDLYLTWSPDYNAEVIGYKVYFDTNTIDENKSGFHNVYDTSSLSAYLTDLDPNYVYKVKVVSLNRYSIKINESEIVYGYPKAQPAPGSVFSIISV